jgi:hypothetical protein
LWLIGHDFGGRETEACRWIGSAGKGQVVYLYLFETTTLRSKGLIRIAGGPGTLIRDGIKYDKVLGRDSSVINCKPQCKVYSYLVVGVENFMPDFKLKWLVSKSSPQLFYEIIIAEIGFRFGPQTDFSKSHMVLAASLLYSTHSRFSCQQCSVIT